MWATRLAIMGRLCLRPPAQWFTARASTIRLTWAAIGTERPTRMELAWLPPGVRERDGVSLSASATPMAILIIIHGGGLGVTTDHVAGALLGATDMAATRRLMSTVVGAILLTLQRKLHGRIRTPATMAREVELHFKTHNEAQ